MHAIESKAQPLPPEPTMRQERTVQATIFEVFAGHEIGCELKTISRWLDRQSTLASLVAGDLRRHGVRETGRRGLPAETVLRCALLKRFGCYFYTAVLPLVVLSRVADRLKWHGHEGARSQMREFGSLPNAMLWAVCRAELPIFRANRLAGLTVLVRAVK
jgi:hypothetical protein